MNVERTEGGVWMVQGKACQSVAREIAEHVMRSLELPTDWRIRDKIIMGISPTVKARWMQRF